MRYYNLYNLLLVRIDNSVPEYIVRAIDFQLNYFSVEENDAANIKGKYLINIYPFKHFDKSAEKKQVTNYTLSGSWKKYYIDSQNRLAVELIENGINIWCGEDNFLITIFIQLLLINEGIIFIHSAGVVNKKGEAVLFTGAGGVGKTSLISEFVKKMNYSLIGDDIIGISNKGECLPFPRSFILKEYHQTVYPELFTKYKKSPLQESILSIKEFIRLNAPFREVIRNFLIKKGIKNSVVEGWHRLPYVAAVPVEKIFGKNSISKTSKVKLIIDLVRYKGDDFYTEKVTEEELLLRINSIIQFEWLSSYQPLVNMSIFRMADFRKTIDKCHSISKSFLQEVDYYTLYVPEKASPEELIDYTVKLIPK